MSGKERRGRLEVKMLGSPTAEVAEAVQPLFSTMTPTKMLVVLADLLVGVAQGAGMSEERVRFVLEEVVRCRAERGWLFGGPPAGVRPS